MSDASVPGPATDPRELLHVERLHTKDELERDFDRVVLDPFDDPARACSLLAPARWVEVRVDVAPDILAADDTQTVPMGGFHPEDDESLTLQVQYLRLSPEFAAEPELEAASTYLQLFTQTAGLEVLVAMPVEIAGGPALQALARGGEPGRGDYTWLLARRAGSILFLVLAGCPERRFKTFRETLATCLHSFQAGR